MKIKLLVAIALVWSVVSHAQNPEKKLSPDELAQTIVDALEELRVSLNDQKLAFSEAELEVSATRSLSGEGGLSIWIVGATYNRTTETSVKVSYGLSKPLAIAKIESELVASTRLWLNEKSLKSLKGKPISDMDMKALHQAGLPKDNSVIELKANETYDSFYNSLIGLKDRRSRALLNAKEIIVNGVKQTLDDYEAIKTKFGDVKFDVSVDFSVERAVEGGLDFKIVSAEGAKTDSWQHSLKLSFGPAE